MIPHGFISVWIVAVSVEVGPGEPTKPLELSAVATDYPHAVVQRCLRTAAATGRSPYPTDRQVLIVTIHAHELVACHLALGWPVPERIVDLAVEFRNQTNGLRLPIGHGLAGALLWFGLPASLALNGSDGRDILRRLDLIRALYWAMADVLDLGRALLRGRYLIATCHFG